MVRVWTILAGLLALASGLAYAAWPLLGQPDWAITAWNLCLIPVALYLGLLLTPRGPLLAAVSVGAGIGASLLWAVGFRHASAEPWWIGLAAVWWLSLGWLLLPVRRATGVFTILLGVATAVDFVVTALGLGQPWLVLGGLKLPLSTVWSVWIGVLLIRSATRGGTGEPARLLSIEASSPLSIVGGTIWIIGGAGWLLTHGISVNFSTATVLGLRGTEFTQLLAVAALLWTVALAARHPVDATTLGRVGWWLAIAGTAMVSTG